MIFNLAKPSDSEVRGNWWKKMNTTVVPKHSVKSTTTEFYTNMFTVTTSYMTVSYSDSFEVYESNGNYYARLVNPITQTYSINNNAQLTLTWKSKYVVLGEKTDELTQLHQVLEYEGDGYPNLYRYSNNFYFRVHSYSILGNFGVEQIHDTYDFVYSNDVNEYPNEGYGSDGYYYKLYKSGVCDTVYKWAKRGYSGGAIIKYVISPYKDAYPNGGEQDGFYYDSKETINVGGTRIASGSYIGTGTSGSANANSLTFDFEPKLVFIFGEQKNYAQIFCYPLNVGIIGSYSNNVNWNGNSISWYYSSDNCAPYQNNTAGTTYNYIAIG